MKAFLNTILQIVLIISFVGTVLFVVFGVYEEIVGPVYAEKLLTMLHVPLNVDQMFIIGAVNLILLLVVLALRKKT